VYGTVGRDTVSEGARGVVERDTQPEGVPALTIAAGGCTRNAAGGGRWREDLGWGQSPTLMMAAEGYPRNAASG